VSDSTDPEQASNPGSDLAGQKPAPGWLDALNSFLERAYQQADVETGC
jgi:hypothetical protein